MLHKLQLLISIILICATRPVYTAAQEYPSTRIDGLSGAKLKEALQYAERPTALLSLSGQWNLLRHIDADSIGNLIDRYSSISFPNQPNGTGTVEGLSIDHVMPPAWWNGTTPAYGDTIMNDMHQIFLCNGTVAELKRDYPPGDVTSPTYSNGYWQVGYGTISGEKVWMYTPAKEYRGDFARCIFYMVTLYPVNMWNGLGINILSDTPYPTLNRYSTSLLLKWHADDPVDNREQKRNLEIYKHQGNHNPYILFPELADHIWGTKSQLPWTNKHESKPPEPIPPGATGPYLHANYTLTDTINLRSPYVPDDASWSIDGDRITGTTIPASQIGCGEHELRFTSSIITGKLKINIK